MPTPRPPRLLTWLLPAVLALGLAACGPGGDRTVAATVNGADIPTSVLEQRFESIADNPEFAQQIEADDGTFAAQVQASLLSGLIQAELVSQGAKELGIEVTEARVEERMAELVEEMGGQQAFDQAVEEAGLTGAEVAEQVRDVVTSETVQERLVADIEVSDAEVEEFYEANRETRYERAGARHILVDTEDEASDVLDRLEGGEDFAEVARDVSTDTESAERGGDLGQFGRGQMVGPFEEAVFGSEEGDVVGPVETDFGFHVIEVLALVSESFEDVADDIRAELNQQRQSEVMQEWIGELTRQAEITVNPRFGGWNAEAAQVTPPDAIDGPPAGGPAQPPPAGGGQAPPAGDPGDPAGEADR